MSIEAVQDFYQRLTNDQAFYRALKNSTTKDDCNAIVQAEGYDFTQTELTDYTAALLESQSDDDALNRIGDKELAMVVGGAIALTGPIVVMPPYGHVPLDEPNLFN